jgi:hypothetical protein
MARQTRAAGAPFPRCADLDVAVARCAANAVELLVTGFGMAEEYAYAYLSAATDFNISQGGRPGERRARTHQAGGLSAESLATFRRGGYLA